MPAQSHEELHKITAHPQPQQKKKLDSKEIRSIQKEQCYSQAHAFTSQHNSSGGSTPLKLKD